MECSLVSNSLAIFRDNNDWILKVKKNNLIGEASYDFRCYAQDPHYSRFDTLTTTYGLFFYLSPNLLAAALCNRLPGSMSAAVFCLIDGDIFLSYKNAPHIAFQCFISLFAI